ncbi:MAG: septum formation initiator family protein [Sporomusaceae bacterium]|nr:septum formation initiator family protein [Sporomusaceae bacterium]
MRIRNRYRIKWFKLVAIGLSFYFMYLYVGQQSQLNAISNETESIRMELTQFQQVNTALKEERNALNDRRYVEKLAREELGLVKPGEVPYIVSEKK